MRVLVLYVLIGLCLPVFACELDGGTTLDAGGSRTLSFKTEPTYITVGEHFSIRIKICKDDQPVSVGSVAVDALMPAHGHGMNYRPSVTTSAEGEYLASGLLFHMPGLWNLQFEIGTGDDKTKIYIDITL